uniref:NAD(P)-binding domain-containing protein n=1 Tax=Chaetoceros debilis TaxID=122233 RepID=A0A7S3QFY4_9STRA
MATVSPSDGGTVGVVGRGFVSVLAAKLAAIEGYKTWMLMPNGQEETIKLLMNEEDDEEGNVDVTLVEATDGDKLESLMESTNAYIFAVDNDTVMDEAVLKFLLKPENAKNVKRVVGMSRNLNGKDMGFFVKASKISAKRQVWDGSTSKEYKAFEECLKECASAIGAEYTIARAGTLKGGASGDSEEPYKQFLTKQFYEMTKRDIVTWNLLFDCDIRGVRLAKGDVLPGPGSKAVFTATGTDAAPGDTSRSGICEAMVKSLAVENAANMDFGVATEESRSPPSAEEWQALFASL